MANLLNSENSGVIVDVRASDFRAGAESGVVYKAVNPSGDWSVLKVTDEWQRRFVPPSTLGYDTDSCTDFSCMNSIELQIMRMLRDNEIPAETITKMKSLGYMDESGNVNFNDWYNAILAGTTPATGNTLYNPWDAVRSFGCLPQSAGHAVNDFTQESQWFAAKPTADQIALGRQFNTLFDVAYEWVAIDRLNQWDLFAYHLKQAPLHVLVPTGSSWNNTLVTVPTPTYVGVNHAITLLGQNAGVSHTILDHYNPFVKTLEWGYYIPYALKGVVTLKTLSTPVPFHHVFNVNLTYGAVEGPEVHALQEALQTLGYMKTGTFGPYGPQTKAALGVFQTVSGITDPNGQGMNFGPLTRAALNKALNN